MFGVTRVRVLPCVLGALLVLASCSPKQEPAGAVPKRAKVAAEPEESTARMLFPDLPIQAELVVLEKYHNDKLYAGPGEAVEIQMAYRNKRDALAAVASTMPRDDDAKGWEMIRMASKYFDRDCVEIWSACREASRPFSPEGLTAKDILLGSLAAAKQLDVKPNGTHSLQRFVDLYLSLRHTDHMDHIQALGEIINRRVFAN